MRAVSQKRMQHAVHLYAQMPGMPTSSLACTQDKPARCLYGRHFFDEGNDQKEVGYPVAQKQWTGENHWIDKKLMTEDAPTSSLTCTQEMA